MLLSDSEIDKLIVDGIINKLRKKGVNSNNMNEWELHDTLHKSVNDKVPNVTGKDTKIKSLLGFLHVEKWCALDPGVYTEI